MKLETSELVQEYYMKVREKYPDMTIEEFRHCCLTPFLFAHQQMATGDLPVIRLKGLGMLFVTRKRAELILYRMERQFAEGKLSPEIYHSKKEMIVKYLKTAEDVEPNKN